MKSIILRMVKIIVAIMIFASPCLADQSPSGFISAEIVNKINLFRENLQYNTLAFVESEKIDPAGLPSWVNSLPSGKASELVWNDILHSVVDARAFEVSGYAAQTQGETLSFAERLSVNGYRAETASEVNGMTFFMNFMPAEVAADVLFRELIRKDLQQGDIRSAVILDPRAKDFSLAVYPGVVTHEAMRYNAYVVVAGAAVLYSTHDAEWLEDSLFIMMNQARIKPLETAELAGVDKNTVIGMFPLKYFFEGAPKLVRATSPVASNTDASVNPANSSSKSSPEINFFVEVESSACKIDIAKILLKKLIETEAGMDGAERIIYRSVVPENFTAIDISVKYAGAVQGKTGYDVKVRIVQDTGAYSNLVSGVFYNDTNNNDFYEPGEEAEGFSLVSSVGDAFYYGRSGSINGVLAEKKTSFDVMGNGKNAHVENADFDKKFVFFNTGKIFGVNP